MSEAVKEPTAEEAEVASRTVQSDAIEACYQNVHRLYQQITLLHQSRNSAEQEHLDAIKSTAKVLRAAADKSCEAAGM